MMMIGMLDWLKDKDLTKLLDKVQRSVP